jgi:hypothetical protein
MERMSEFNWVRARNDCSLGQVFEQLRLGVQGDIEERQKLRESSTLGDGIDHGFCYASKGNRFSATVKTGTLQLSIIFTLKEDCIIVTGEDDQEMFRATLTLTNDRECRLVVASEEMEQWQFRKKALERLFFSLSDFYISR